MTDADLLRHAKTSSEMFSCIQRQKTKGVNDDSNDSAWSDSSNNGVTQEAADAFCRRHTANQVLCMLKATEGGKSQSLPRDLLLSYVARNFCDMYTCPRFVTLRGSLLRAVLKSDQLIASETAVVRAVAKWARWDLPSRKSDVRAFEPLLRFEDSPLQCCAIVLANWDVFRHAEGDSSDESKTKSGKKNNE